MQVRTKEQLETDLAFIKASVDELESWRENIRPLFRGYDSTPDSPLRLHIDLLAHFSNKLYNQLKYTRDLIKNKIDDIRTSDVIADIDAGLEDIQ